MSVSEDQATFFRGPDHKEYISGVTVSRNAGVWVRVEVDFAGLGEYWLLGRLGGLIVLEVLYRAVCVI